MTNRIRYAARQAYRFALRTGRMSVRIDNLDCVVDLDADECIVTDVLGVKCFVPIHAAWVD